VPSVCTSSWITPGLFAPSVPDDALTLAQPLREPMRPNWSITQFVATKAKPAAKSVGESCVFRPRNPGAEMLAVWRAWLMLQKLLILWIASAFQRNLVSQHPAIKLIRLRRVKTAIFATLDQRPCVSVLHHQKVRNKHSRASAASACGTVSENGML
jgi:hypothetical protein